MTTNLSGRAHRSENPGNSTLRDKLATDLMNEVPQDV